MCVVMKGLVVLSYAPWIKPTWHSENIWSQGNYEYAKYFCCTAWSISFTMHYLVSHTPHQGLKLVDTNNQLPPETYWLLNDRIYSEPGHNCFNPLRLPSPCTPDLYNGVWLLTPQKRFNSAKFQKNYDNFSESSQWKIRSGSIFFVLNLIFHGVSLKSDWQNKQKTDQYFIKQSQSALPASAHGGQDIENSLSEPRAKVRQPVPKLSNKQFSKKKIF